MNFLSTNNTDFYFTTTGCDYTEQTTLGGRVGVIPLHRTKKIRLSPERSFEKNSIQLSATIYSPTGT